MKMLTLAVNGAPIGILTQEKTLFRMIEGAEWVEKAERILAGLRLLGVPGREWHSDFPRFSESEMKGLVTPM